MNEFFRKYPCVCGSIVGSILVDGIILASMGSIPVVTLISNIVSLIIFYILDINK